MSERRHTFQPVDGHNNERYASYGKVETVSLPENIEAQLEAEVLPKFLELARESGVTEQELERFVEAYKNFGEARPAVLSLDRKNSFNPTLGYFGTAIGFNVFSAPIPDVLIGSSYKLRKKQDVPPKAEKIDGAAVLEQFEGEGESEIEKVSGYEKYLAKVNRLIYRLHESLHVFQGLAVGDTLNKLKDEQNAHDLFDKDEEVRMLKRTSLVSLEGWNWPKWTKDSVLIKPEKTFPTDRLSSVPQIANNEATMDIISEWMMKDIIRTQPELCLWLHNTMCHLAEGLREMHASLITAIEQKDPRLFKQTNFDNLTHALGLISSAYFSAFSNTSEAKEFLDSQTFSTKDESAEAAIASIKPFDQFELASLTSELTDQVGKPKPTDPESHMFKTWWKHKRATGFPSGKVYLSKNESRGPITQKGAEIVAKIVSACCDRGYNARKVSTMFSSIKERGMSPGEAIDTIKKHTGLELTPDDLLEIRNVDNYLYFNILYSSDYPFQVLVRKAIMNELRTTHPEQVAPLIKWTFFESPYQFDDQDYYDLTGFNPAVGGETDDSENPSNWHGILSDTKLGIMNINVPALSPEQQARLKKLVGRPRSDKSLHGDTLIKLIELAREQKDAQKQA